jgi:hypothetical protein
VSNASQTTYVFRNLPKQIRITRQSHPLCGQSVEVLRRRRLAGETHWIVRLPDGTASQIPSSWTDYPVGQVPIETMRSGCRATPESLRKLISLVECLVPPNPLKDACPNISSSGGQHGQAVIPIRSPNCDMGATAMGSNRCREASPDTLDSFHNGQDFTGIEMFEEIKGGGQ